MSPGLLPWNTVPGKACGMTLSNVCKTREVSDACRQNVILFLVVNPQRDQPQRLARDSSDIKR